MANQSRAIQPIPQGASLDALIAAFNTLVGDYNRSIGADKIGAEAWTDCSVAPTGFSGTPTDDSRFLRMGGFIALNMNVTGTSNATTFTITLPAPAKVSVVTGLDYIKDNGTPLTTGLITLTAGSRTATLNATVAAGAFTNVGTKAVSSILIYEPA